MGYAARASWKGLEREAKKIFWIVIGDVEDSSACRLVDQFDEGAPKLRKGKVFGDLKVFIVLSYSIESR